MKRIAVAVVVVVVSLVVIVLGRIVVRSGMLTTLAPHRTVDCRSVEGVVGAEDVTIDGRTQTAYLSAFDRRKRMAGAPERGEIYGLDLTRADAMPVPLTGGQPADFRPHGISLWQGADGTPRLFVINHRSTGEHEVVLYDVAPGRLQFVESITYPELTSPNDLVAVGPRQFYASNDRGYRKGTLMGVAEGLLQLPAASVSYFDGTNGRLAVEGLIFANGMNVSSDGTTVYVAECLRRAVGVYDRDVATGAMSRRERIDLGTCPDNIEVDEEGKLWIAAHPKLFQFLEHAEDATQLSPTQVLRVDPHTNAVAEVFLDDGTLLSGTATAAVAGKHMVLSPVFDPKVLVCDRPVLETTDSADPW